ncbi:iron transporter [Pilimelia terevasa]|uniref:Iron transporter n=2 Tax=Pilimelia terevasa TaxID=53372 RepID=A0A8J3FEF2_9ACTN|nr:iron uptake transporter permease EfeU [Pilimelia terevasa]GGK15421.1 iron transporter [Pilimelia terevasa]
MSQASFATYLIGLREGLEATLVVSILVAFLVKSDRRRVLPMVWLGAGVAVLLSVGFGALLTFTQASVSGRNQELFEAVTSVAAVCFVTWMIFWMRGAARRMGGELRAGLGQALALGPAAVAAFSFLAVVREGLETALLFFTAARGAATATPLVAITLGVLTAIGMGYLLYATAVRINLGTFFRWTGALLVLVAGGILKYGVHDFQEAGVLPGLGTLAFDVTATVDPGSWYATLLTGMVNLTPRATVLEMAAWAAYVVPTMILFLRPAGSRPAAPPADAAATAPAQA